MPVMVKFLADGATWLVPVDDVVGIRSIGDIRPLPSPDASVVGVIDHQGRACPVVDALGAKGTRVIVLTAGDAFVGATADDVSGVIEFDSETLQPRPVGQDRPLVAATHGSGEHLAFVLSTEELARPLRAHPATITIGEQDV